DLIRPSCGLGDVHRDLARLCFFSLGQVDGQDTFFIVGLDLARIDRCRQSDAALEATEVALAAEGATFLLLALVLPLPADGQYAIVQADVDVLLLPSRQPD